MLCEQKEGLLVTGQNAGAGSGRGRRNSPAGDLKGKCKGVKEAGDSGKVRGPQKGTGPPGLGYRDGLHPQIIRGFVIWRVTGKNSNGHNSWL